MSSPAFCTCKDHQCPFHPTNHEKGCTPCIEKNLKGEEIPSCFFHKVSAEADGVKDFTFGGFAKLVMNKT